MENSNEQQFCFFKGLIRYAEPITNDYLRLTVNKSESGFLVHKGEIPCYGNLLKVQSFVKTLRNQIS